MSRELEDYIEMASDKRRRTQPQTSQGDTNPENENRTSLSSCQTTNFLSRSSSSKCDNLKMIANNGNSSDVNKYLRNGRDHDVGNNQELCRSVFSGDRAALYRNIYNSSSSEDDDDEHCVYTYKGSEAALDLPNSFSHSNAHRGNRETMSACSSPEMDFLEMDFDPGPTNGQDSDSDSGSMHRQSTFHPNQDDLVSASNNADRIIKGVFDIVQQDAYDENANCCANEVLVNANTSVENSLNTDSVENFVEESILHENPCCSKILKAGDVEIDGFDHTVEPLGTAAKHYSDLSSDEELPIRRGSNSNVGFIANNQGDRKSSEDSDSEDITFIPNGCHSIESEVIGRKSFDNLHDISPFCAETGSNHFVCYDDILSLDPSYCISSVINVMKILKDSQCYEREQLINLLRPKQVPENTPLVEYLFMRSVQNANEVDLRTFASVISENELHSRFFNTYPSTDFNLVEWLYSWMRKGVVPVVTRNIQERGTLATKNIIRNPWRHNVVYKIESPYIHVLNPSEKILDCVLHRQLSQPSLIHVKRKCILHKWHSKVDLRLLMRANHNRWYNENVLGQVVTIIRENDNDTHYTKYVRIPSNCRCGITLFVPSENSTLCREIDEAEELTSTVYG